MSDPPYHSAEFSDLEISTQILIQDAQERGIEVEILDRSSNFIALRKEGHVEYVKQATKTSRDSYITFLMMENKSVCKKILNEADLIVPNGEAFSKPEEAARFCESTPWERFVIKPTTTNFGIGIAICTPATPAADAQAAIHNALSLSETVIVEEFVDGFEYRFLVIDFKTVAVCKRIPANVIGNGESTIEELVQAKNEDSRRGKGHKTPLERIELEDTEQSVLSEDYGFDAASIPRKDQLVFLRRNSNISTGGDSIDVTDDCDPFYRDIAERAAKCLNAKVCGVDLIAPDLATQGPYAILELNFNPVLYIHNYPYEGKNRRAGEKILDLLGF